MRYLTPIAFRMGRRLGAGGIVHHVTLTACALAFVSVAACASAAPSLDNPDHLAGDQISQIAHICQTVMGLRASDRPVWGVHPGDIHLAIGASHYQGCIASLSDSLLRAETVQAATQADSACRARGLAPGSPALAVCVLQSTRSTPAPATAAAARVTPVGSFFYASPHQLLRREQLACAQLGLEPPYGAFTACVSDLQRTFFAIDNPIE